MHISSILNIMVYPSAYENISGKYNAFAFIDEILKLLFKTVQKV